MNALTQVKPAPFDLSAAHMEAHRWVEIARPLIVAYLKLDHVQADVLAAAHGVGVYRHDLEYSSNRIGQTVYKLRQDIEDLRDQIIGDLSPPAPNFGRNLNECSPDVIDYDDLCDMWAERIRDVASVDAAIDREARS